jgi:hypothetical protein
MNILKFGRVVIAAVAILAFGVACGDRSSSDQTVGKRDPKAFKWGVIFTPTERMIKIGGGVGYCAGDPRPRFRRPDVEYRGEDVYIRLELKARRSHASRNGLCLGSERLVMRTITLRRDLSDLRLYDSGIEPPELRWPR